MGNLIVRLHVRLRILVVIFFMLSIVLLWFVRINTCRSYIQTWAGVLLMSRVRIFCSAEHPAV